MRAGGRQSTGPLSSPARLQRRGQLEDEGPAGGEGEGLVAAHEAAMCGVEEVAHREVHGEGAAWEETGEAGAGGGDGIAGGRDVTRVDARLVGVGLAAQREISTADGTRTGAAIEAQAVENTQRRNEGERNAGRRVLTAH